MTKLQLDKQSSNIKFSHTTGSHAKPNQAAWPLLTQPLLLCYNFANNWLKVNETRRIGRYKYITTPKNLNELEKHLKGVGGRGRSGNGGWQQTKLYLAQTMWPKQPRTPEPRLPAMCEKNVFRFIRSSASGKPYFTKSVQKLRYYILHVIKWVSYNLNHFVS